MFSYNELQKNVLFNKIKLKIIKNDKSKIIYYFEHLFKFLDNDYHDSMKLIEKSMNESMFIKEYPIVCTENESIEGLEGFLVDFYEYAQYGNSKKIFVDMENILDIQKFISGHRLNKNLEIYKLYYERSNDKKEWCTKFNFELIKDLNENIIADIVNMLDEKKNHLNYQLFKIIDTFYHVSENNDLKLKLKNLIVKSNPVITLLYGNIYQTKTLELFFAWGYCLFMAGRTKDLDRLKISDKGENYKIEIINGESYVIWNWNIKKNTKSIVIDENGTCNIIE